MRIAHVCVASFPPLLNPTGGAIQRRVIELAKVQASRGHEVSAFSVGYQSAEESVEGVDVRFLRTRTTGRPLHPEFQLRVLSSLARKRSTRPDVVHVHSEPEAGLVGKVLGIPTVLSYDYFKFRGIGKEVGAAYRSYRWLLGLHAALLPCSRYCADESQRYWRLPKVDVIYNGVNMQQFRPDGDAAVSERARLGMQGHVILYMGRVCEQKGTDVLLSAYKLLAQRRSDVSLVIAGPIGLFSGGNDAAELHRWSKAIADAGGVYLGALDESRLRGLLNLADVFVMPTRELEMFGMAAVEAQACGTPVIASDHGGLRETVPEAVGGRFPVGDAIALSRQIDALLSNEERRRRCGRAAEANARRFEWVRIVEALDTIYERVARAR